MFIYGGLGAAKCHQLHVFPQRLKGELKDEMGYSH